MNDLIAVLWKECRELLSQRGPRGLLGIGLFIVVFGVVLPLQSGPAWVTSPMTAVAWAWAPLFLVATVVADAFAGERERHTLETLLASRLSDRAILFGKMGAAVLYGATVTGVSLGLGLVAVNVVHGRGRLLLYPLPIVQSIVVIGLLGAVLLAAIGVLISLRAATVRQAQQELSGAIVALAFLPVVAIRVLPASWKATLAAHPTIAAQAAVVGVVALAGLAAGAVALAVRSFRRGRLVHL